MSLPDLVIFDCDGVLVDSEPVSNRVLSENLVRYGYEITPANCVDLFAGGTIAGAGDYLRGLGVDLPETWIPEIYSEIHAALRAGVDLIPGIPDLLDHLEGHAIPFCVGSNGSMEKMHITLGQHGIMGRFTGVFSARDIGPPKPDPMLYLHIADWIGCRPDQAVVIEDSIAGVRAAVAGGFRCFGYAPEGDGARLRSHGAEVFHHMGDVPGMLLRAMT